MGGRPRRDPGSRLDSIVESLQETWGHATCELTFENAYQLTVATILSAQSTDKLINTVTPRLFARYPTPQALAQADIAEVEAIVRSTGFFRQKAKNIVSMARRVVEVYGGEIPRTMEEMITLPGVARKTANVVLGNAYGIASGITVDTHVKRVSRRLHLTSETDPVKIERDLMQKIPKERWISISQQLIWHGRRLCHARVPACDRCPLAPLCPEATV